MHKKVLFDGSLAAPTCPPAGSNQTIPFLLENQPVEVEKNKRRYVYRQQLKRQLPGRPDNLRLSRQIGTTRTDAVQFRAVSIGGILEYSIIKGVIQSYLRGEARCVLLRNKKEKTYG